MTNITCTVTIEVHAPQAVVWDALINPVIVKQYFFGTDLICDWKVGSPIRFVGEWEGKPYEDKGTVLAFEHGQRLRYDYFSSFSGLPDVPQNYQTISYQLSEQNGLTTLVITQSNCQSEAVKNHSEQNWKMVMDGMKKLVERK
jgi:uncharacterized protein YndB with AHSA1/START domain